MALDLRRVDSRVIVHLCSMDAKDTVDDHVAVAADLPITIVLSAVNVLLKDPCQVWMAREVGQILPGVGHAQKSQSPGSRSRCSA